MADPPDHLKANKNRQHEDNEMLHETGRGIKPRQQDQPATNRQQGHLIAGLRLEVGKLLGAFFLGRQFLGRGLFRGGGNRLHLGRWRRKRDLFGKGHRGAADHVIFHVVIDHTVFLRRQIGHHMAHIGGIKRRALGRHPGREIGVADNANPIVRHDFFVRNRQLAIAAPLRSQIDNHRARLHQLDHVSGPQHRRVPSRDQRGGDHDVDLGRQIAELGQLLFAEFRARRRGISTRCGPVLHLGRIEFQEHEFRPHALDLLGHFGAHVKRIGDRAQRGRSANRGQPGHPGTNHQHLGRGHFARRGDLPGEEAPEIAARLDHRAIAGDIGHRGQRVHLLGPADPGHHVHGNHRRPRAPPPFSSAPRSGRDKRTRSGSVRPATA